MTLHDILVKAVDERHPQSIEIPAERICGANTCKYVVVRNILVNSGPLSWVKTKRPTLITLSQLHLSHTPQEEHIIYTVTY